MTLRSIPQNRRLWWAFLNIMNAKNIDRPGPECGGHSNNDRAQQGGSSSLCVSELDDHRVANYPEDFPIVSALA